MLSLQRSSPHPSPMVPWFAQPLGETSSSNQTFWLQMAASNVNKAAVQLDNSTFSSTSSSTASTTAPAKTTGSDTTHKSFYPSSLEVAKSSIKQTRSTLRPVNVTNELNLPSDPRSWLREDVQTWIRYMAEIHGLPKIDSDRFLMNGKALCLMTMDMFCQRVPLGGKMLYKEFQLRLSMAMYNSC